MTVTLNDGDMKGIFVQARKTEGDFDTNHAYGTFESSGDTQPMKAYTCWGNRDVRLGFQFELPGKDLIIKTELSANPACFNGAKQIFPKSNNVHLSQVWDIWTAIHKPRFIVPDSFCCKSFFFFHLSWTLAIKLFSLISYTGIWVTIFTKLNQWHIVHRKSCHFLSGENKSIRKYEVVQNFTLVAHLGEIEPPAHEFTEICMWIRRRLYGRSSLPSCMSIQCMLDTTACEFTHYAWQLYGTHRANLYLPKRDKKPSAIHIGSFNKPKITNKYLLDSKEP